MKLISMSMTRQVGRVILHAKKNSPHIFFAGGLVGSVTSTIMACKATLKLEPTLDEIRKDLIVTKELSSSESKTEQEYYRDLTKAYIRSGVKIGKLYAPSVALSALSVGSLTGSHIQMTRRNTALTAVAASWAKAYDDYRERVREAIGDEKELDLHRAITQEEVTVDGKKQLIQTADPNKWSVYARIFDESSPNWKPDPELNRYFVQGQQNYANHVLQARGHIFLNEVYDALGLERSRAGAVVGWVLNGEASDNYIDFGMFDAYSAPFVNNMERSIVLDFNVDGVIYDKI